MSLTIALFILFFSIIVIIHFQTGLFFLFLLLPTYLVRFNIGPIPTNLLEMMALVLILVWSIKQVIGCRLQETRTPSTTRNPHPISSLIKKYHSLFLPIALFLLAATISIFTSINLRAALGEWKAFYLEPMLIFLVLITIFHKSTINTKLLNPKSKIQNPNYNLIIFPLILSGLITSIFAIYQHFTGWLVPWDFWQNNGSYRVTAWYGFPNGVGLFLAPLVPLAMYLVIHSFKEIKRLKYQISIRQLADQFPIKSLPSRQAGKIQKYLQTYKPTNLQTAQFLISILFLISSPLAIFYARSTGALIGLAAGIGFLLLLYQKTRLITITLGIVSLVGLLSLPFDNSLKQELLLEDRSGQIRLAIWQETLHFLSDHPLVGAGLASYQTKITPYHTTVHGEGIEIFHHPHNIFLTMWVNLGLLGLISFVWLLYYSIFYILYSKFKKQKKLSLLNYFSLATLVVVITTGLVDSPYIKNDLAILFWTIIALIVTSTNPGEVDKTE